jgi:hypothetical protein
MRGRLSAVAGLSALAWAVAAAATGQPPAAPKPPTPAAPTVTKVSGPFTHENLTVFVLHGPDVLPGRKFLTLSEALEQKKAVVHETSSVNQLSVENVSADTDLFLQNGDIVKGGKQDRLIGFDLVVPPKSGLVSISSFCCEQGRWTGRRGESVAMFEQSSAQAAGKDLKLAVNEARMQAKVWEEVKKSQEKLSQNVGKPVNSAASPTSYQLAIEDKDLQERVGKYEKALAGLLADKADVTGVVFAVNGKVQGAEIYGSPALMTKLWAKLLKAAAVDAVAQYQKDKKFDAITPQAVETFLAEASKGEAKEVVMNQGTVPNGRGQMAAQVNAARQALGDAQGQAQQALRPGAANPPPAGPGTPQAAAPPVPPVVGLQVTRVRILQIDSGKNLVVECQDSDKPGVLIHRSYIAR